MNISMAGMDHEHADIALREKFAFVQGQIGAVLQTVYQHPYVAGCAIISTCNRVELYLSGAQDTTLYPVDLLCQAFGVRPTDCKEAITVRHDKNAVQHLFEVAAGLQSQILGEDQILSQVKRAAKLAREAHTMDAVLETLFRCAATAGKEVKTETRLTAVPLSAAHRGVAVAEQRLQGLQGKRAVVIGNGEMGRLACDLLVQHGAKVTVTLRSYRHGETIVPRGCSTQPYDARLEVLEGCDLVVSATTSPHYTLTKEQLLSLRDKPRLLIDLAMPRDIQPAAASVVEVCNIDDLGHADTIDEQEITQVRQILERHIKRFYGWARYRESLPAITEVEQILFDRIWNGEGDEEAIHAAVNRSVNLLLGSISEIITPQLMKKAQNKLVRKKALVKKVRNRV